MSLFKNNSSLNRSDKPVFNDPVNTDTYNIIILVILSSIVIILNGFITILFIADKKLRKQPANILICSQVCADLYTGIVFIPLYLVKNEQLETIEPFLSGYMLYVELFNLLALSVDRYLAFLKPLLHHKLMNKCYIRKIVILVWTVPLGLTLIPLFWWFNQTELKKKLQRIYVCTVWSLMLAIVLIITMLYLFITKQTRRSIRGRMADPRLQMDLISNKSPRPGRVKKRQRTLGKVELKANKLAKKELRVVHLFGLLLFFLVAAYSPILYMNIFIVMLQKPSFISKKVICISLYFLILNSVVTPVLCILLKKDYIDAIKKWKHLSRKYIIH